MNDNKVLMVRPGQLCGRVRVSGAKNSALKLLAASLLTDEDVINTNFPNGLLDIKIHIDMLRLLGKVIEVGPSHIKISAKGSLNSELIWQGRSIRNTLLIMGAVLARTGKSKVPLPGGCNIGERKYDLHQMVLEKLGANVWREDDYLCAEAPNGLQGNEIHLPIRSTGVTENAIISSCLAKGKTVLWNPHIRPEVMDLITMLCNMGADIEVRGNESIIIKGVSKLKGVEHRVIPDNMEALTYLIASVVTKGDVEIEDFPTKHLEVPLIFLQESGTKIYYGSNSIIVRGGRCYPLEISTGPYPGINSDMQPLLAVYALCSKGRSKIVDLRFPDRFVYSNELKKLGGDVQVIDNMLVIKGGKTIYGTDVIANDLRAGAALLIAGMVAKGETLIHNAEQIERGYEDFLNKFLSLGAKISWVSQISNCEVRNLT